VDLDSCPRETATPVSSEKKLWEPTPSVYSSSGSGVVRFIGGRSIPGLRKEGLTEGEHIGVTHGSVAALETSEVTGGHWEGLINVESRGAQGCKTMKRGSVVTGADSTTLNDGIELDG
jgi:hypothetical protein